MNCRLTLARTAMNSAGRSLAGIAVVSALLVAGCGKGTSSTGANEPSQEPTPTLATAPDSARIDLATPTFSDPTAISNPLFPITAQTQTVQVGSEGDTALRNEITLLPGAKTIEWNGQQIETVVSQFVAYGDGRILEVARDFFAQADDGSVWYFGEDVSNYTDGVLDDHDGTWLAGADGPPGMIMPANPQVGDVYRPENIPGVVFEETTVKSVNEAVDGPQGPITKAVLVQELGMDGVVEDKIFAPGYGEFFTHVPAEDELATVAIGVPLDAVSGPAPGPLASIATGAAEILAAAGDAAAAQLALGTVAAAWDAYPTSDVPPLVAEEMDQALGHARTAVDAQDVIEIQSAAFELAQAGLDLRMRHESTTAVDLGRLDVSAQRLMADAEQGDVAAVAGDIVVLQAILDRVAHTLDDATSTSVQDLLGRLGSAVDADDLGAAAGIAQQLRSAVDATG